MSRRSRRITKFHTFTRYGPARQMYRVEFLRWAWLAFLLSPSTAHALTIWLAR